MIKKVFGALGFIASMISIYTFLFDNFFNNVLIQTLFAVGSSFLLGLYFGKPSDVDITKVDYVSKGKLTIILSNFIVFLLPISLNVWIGVINWTYYMSETEGGLVFFFFASIVINLIVYFGLAALMELLVNPSLNDYFNSKIEHQKYITSLTSNKTGKKTDDGSE